MLTDKHIYWVGPRNSDIDSTKDLFFGSITIFGDGQSFGEGKDKNYAYCLGADCSRRNHNVNNTKENAFFFDTIERLIQKDNKARFLFYNPNAVFFIYSADDRQLSSLNTAGQFMCINAEDVMRRSNDKRCFAQLLKGKVPLLDRQDDVSSNDGDYNSLLRSFGCTVDESPRFVFQAPISSGGNGTYIVSKDTDLRVIGQLKRDEKYIVSIYQENNVPINIHAIIFDDHTVLTPGSVQIIKEGSNNHGEHRLLYRGADFVAYRELDADLRARFEEAVLKACEVYRGMNYRGVCGIDGIVCGKNVYLLETNNRFQASTSLINRAAREQGLPSVYQLNIAAFDGEWDDAFLQLHDLRVDYSNFSFAATDEVTKMHTRHIYDVCTRLTTDEARRQAHIVDMELDGLNWDQPMEELAYLFRLVFDKSITSIGPEHTMFLNENITEPNKGEWFDHLDTATRRGVLSGDDPAALLDFCLHLKISLLVQGVTFTPAAKQELKSRGWLREATNNAVDLRIDLDLDAANYPGKTDKYLIINAPVAIDFVQLSPFSIHLDKNAPEKERLKLYYYDRLLTVVGTYPVDTVSYQINKNGAYEPRMTQNGKAKQVRYDEVAFLSTDRLRVHITNHCIFKAHGVGCKFCNIKPTEDVLDPANIREVVKAYCDAAATDPDIHLTHFLVGGQTAPEADERIVQAIEIIREFAYYKDIYAMIVPCKKETLAKLYNAGLTQISCNIEVFDDELARSIMPGKRTVKREAYKDCLRNATRYFGRTGNVRTMVIVGLEPHKSMVDGIKEFAACGIQPILSIFRPLPNTPMAGLQAPPMQYLKRVYYELSAICRQNGLHLGPECVNCQNNTLALPVWMEDAVKHD